MTQETTTATETISSNRETEGTIETSMLVEKLHAQDFGRGGMLVRAREHLLKELEKHTSLSPRRYFELAKESAELAAEGDIYLGRVIKQALVLDVAKTLGEQGKPLEEHYKRNIRY